MYSLKKFIATFLIITTIILITSCQPLFSDSKTTASNQELVSRTDTRSDHTTIPDSSTIQQTLRSTERTTQQTKPTIISTSETEISEASSASKNCLDSDELISNPGTSNSFVYQNPPTSSINCNDYQYYEQPVSYDGKEIYGMVYLPKNYTSGTLPTVIISHGIGSNHEGNSMCAKVLASAGFAAYCFDFCGGSPISKSSGSMQDMSILTEEADLNAVITTILEQPFTDKEHLFLLGSSQGGCVTALAADKWQDSICAIVYYYPAFNIPLNAQSLYPNQTAIPEEVTAFDFPVGKRYYEDARTIDIYKILSNFPKDVCIIHGNADSVVDISYSRRAVETIPSCELLELDGVEHNYEGEIEKTTAFLALQFFKRHI